MLHYHLVSYNTEHNWTEDFKLGFLHLSQNHLWNPFKNQLVGQPYWSDRPDLRGQFVCGLFSVGLVFLLGKDSTVVIPNSPAVLILLWKDSSLSLFQSLLYRHNQAKFTSLTEVYNVIVLCNIFKRPQRISFKKQTNPELHIIIFSCGLTTICAIFSCFNFKTSRAC